MTQEETRKRLNDIAHAIDERLPEKYGFLVLITPFGTDQILNYASNMERKDAVNMLKEWLLKCGAAEDWMKHIR